MSKTFWEKEYKDPRHLAMSDEPAEDLIHFAKWTVRNAEWNPFPKDGFTLDIGCGNGRNIINLCEEYNMHGLGIDISSTAIEQATNKTKTKNLKINYVIMEVKDRLPIEDATCDVVLDMMTSHFLNEADRKSLALEIARVTKPYGWVMFKTFIMDGDSHAKRLIKEFPAGEEGSYIHPKIKVAEHVFTEQEIYDLFSPNFKIFKMLKSYKHVLDGKPHKRRTVSVYLERKRD